ncbi:MAG: hypothetical protein Q8L85_01835 [Alphaproteobacteria bacterium]|nr:hypothetical protein [Alphaproteobacteria bacterium]
MFIKKKALGFIGAIFALTFSCAEAEHPIEKTMFFEEKNGDFVQFFKIENEYNDNYVGFSDLYTRTLGHGKHPVFHPYNPDSSQWLTLANINVIPGTDLFHNIVEQNPNLLQLMYKVSGKNPNFYQDAGNIEEFKIKIVIQEITPRDMPYESAANPLAFRPQYYTVPHAQANARNAEDAIGQNMRVAFLPIDGLPLTLINQFPRGEIQATATTPFQSFLPLITYQSKETFQTNVSVHPQDPARKAADGVTPAPFLNNVLSGPVPAVGPDFLQRNIDGEIKPRAIWSVLYQISEPKFSNPLATLHIFVPPASAQRIKDVSADEGINTFEDWVYQTGLIDLFVNQEAQYEQLNILPIDFDAITYRRLNLDLDRHAETINKRSEEEKTAFAIQHYLNDGKREGRKYVEGLPADFDPLVYRRLNRDLDPYAETINKRSEEEKTAFAIQHYLSCGKKENRKYK